MILVGLSAWFTPTLVQAQVVVPEPSPRPPVDFSSERANVEAGPDYGLVTGTVIDLATGAPVPGVQVSVGPLTLVTDANGNYGEWVPPGTYSVRLMVDSANGVVVPDAQAVSVQAGERTVQHLSFRTPATPNVVTAAEDVAMVAPDPAVMASTPPRVLPRTGLFVDEELVWFGMGVLLVLAGLALWNKPLVRLAPATPRRSDAELLAALLAGDESR
jgi:hypothetical protein